MNKNVIISPAIRNQQQWYAMDILLQELMARMDLTKLLIYFIDKCDDRVLPFLAEEFDVLGVKGWDFCRNKDEQRALLRKAVQLHRYRGTLWAVEQVLEQAGLYGAVVDEGTGAGPTGWAVFRITVPFSMMPTDPAVVPNALAMVQQYKRGSAVLEGIFYSGLDFEDSVNMSEEDLVIDADETLMGDVAGTRAGFLYDGTVAFDGSRNYAPELDTITIELV